MVSVTLHDPEEDRHSVHSLHSIASTVATTTSLATRLRELNLDFSDKLRDTHVEEEEEGGDSDRDKAGEEGGSNAGNRATPSPLPEEGGGSEGPEQEEEERESSSMLPAAALGQRRISGAGSGRHGRHSEEDLGLVHPLHLLQPLQVCARLFDRRSHPPLPLKRMTMAQVEDFRQHGYVVLDGLLTKEAAGRLKAEACRAAQKGLLQPVNAASMGIMSSSSSLLIATGGGCSGHGLALSSSPCSSTSSQHDRPPSWANGSSRSTPVHHTSARHQQQQPSPSPPPSQQQQQLWGELRMPLVLGQPPADTAVFAPLMAGLQELQEDLSEFVRLRSRGQADYCLCQLPGGGAPVPRHKDAQPDDGRRESGAAGSSTAATVHASGAAAAAAGSGQQQQQQQPHPAGPAARRVSVFVFLNTDWDKDGGGVVRLWPPQRPTGPPSMAAASSSAAGARRSPTSSDAGTTFSEISDCGSLRVAFLGSTTSSVVAEASAPDHDSYSLDGLSVADSEAERQGFEWVECDGGEMALDIAPLAGRVLLVLSGAVEHALLPGSASSSPGAGDSAYVRAWCC